MKTFIKIFFLFVVISLVAGCNKTNDLNEENSSDVQLKSADNRTVEWRFYPSQDEYYCPIICDGEVVDFLIGDGESLIAHARAHIVDGQMVKIIGTIQGKLQSKKTQEIFRINEQNKFYNYVEGVDGVWENLTAHTNAVGDMGTHLIMSMTIDNLDDFQNGVFTLTKAMCVPNSDKDQANSK